MAQLPAGGGPHWQLAVSGSRGGIRLHPRKVPAWPEASQGGLATCMHGAQRRSFGDDGSGASQPWRTVAGSGEEHQGARTHPRVPLARSMVAQG